MKTKLHNQSVATLADRAGALKAMIAEIEIDTLGPLQAELAEIKAAFVEAGINAVEGQDYRVTISHSSRWNLDRAAVVEELGEDWVTAHSKLCHVTTMRVGARTAGKARKAA